MHAGTRLVKRLRARHGHGLEAREPALLNLPVPVPSNIPLLSPVLDPLVGGIPASDLSNFPSNLPPLASLPPLISLPLPTPPPHTTAPAPDPTSGPVTPTATATPVSSPSLPVSVPVVTPTSPPLPIVPPLPTSPPAPAPAPPANTPEPPPPAPVAPANSPAPQPPVPALSQPAPIPQPPQPPVSVPQPIPPSPSSAPQIRPQTPSPLPPQPPPGPSGGDAPGGASASQPSNADGGGGTAGGQTPGNGASPTASQVPSGVRDGTTTLEPVSQPASAGASGTALHTFSLTGTTPVHTLTLPDGQPVPIPTQNAVANPGADPATQSSIADPFSGTSTIVTFTAAGSLATGAYGASPGASGTNASGRNGGGGGGNSSDPNGSDSHHGLSTAVIAVLVVLGVLVLLVLLFFCCRRRAIAQRLARRKQWFNGEKAAYGATAVDGSGYLRENPAPSVRSSFGTSYEHNPDPFSMRGLSLGPLVPSVTLQSTPPQVQGSNTYVIALPLSVATTASPPSPTFRSGSRSSTGSYDTASSGPSALDTPLNASAPQFLLIPDPPADDEPHTPVTPLSVRPFTPSESFSFPMPPRRSSTLHPPPRACSTSPDSLATSDYATAQSHADPFADGDPFLDPADSDAGHTAESFLTADTTAAHFSAVEVVRRPFVARRDDEMEVMPGDRVHVFRRYDDGWAFAENIGTGARGLFPIDCLRMPHQDLGTFLAEKRLSTYAGPDRPTSSVSY